MSERVEQRQQEANENQLISIDTLDIYEKNRIVNTPRSLQACKREGIKPNEILYRPREDFKGVSKDPQVQELHFQFFEQKRLNMVQQVKNAKQKMINDEEQHSHYRSISERKTKNNTFDISVYSSTMKQSDTLSKAQSKQLRLIENMLRNEEMMINKYNELQKQNEIRELKAKEEQMQQTKLEKKKLEEQRIREIKKQQKRKQEEMEQKRAAQQIFKKNLKEQQRTAELEEKKKEELRIKMQINEQKRQEQIFRAEENLKKVEKERLMK